jgi:hypothetical protein
LPKLLTAGTSVGGTLVGGLTEREARAMIQRRFARPLTLFLSASRKVRVTPAELGVRANLDKALRTAWSVRGQGFLVPLDVRVAPSRIDALLGRYARAVAAKPRDARLVLRDLVPTIVPDRSGWRLDLAGARRAIDGALRSHRRGEVVLPVIEKPAKVRADSFPQAIVIHRGSNRLSYYVDGKLKRKFAVATGQAQYPTPVGRFTIVDMQRNPWWYPPTTSSWAEGLAPVPPGPGNPLGTRWMGLSVPLVGIHGTPNAASIGYSASHGCVRMLIPEVEWLFERVRVGTPVFIVRAA